MAEFFVEIMDLPTSHDFKNTLFSSLTSLVQQQVVSSRIVSLFSECTQESAELRPTMEQVVIHLQDMLINMIDQEIKKQDTLHQLSTRNQQEIINIVQDEPNSSTNQDQISLDEKMDMNVATARSDPSQLVSALKPVHPIDLNEDLNEYLQEKKETIELEMEWKQQEESMSTTTNKINNKQDDMTTSTRQPKKRLNPQQDEDEVM